MSSDFQSDPLKTAETNWFVRNRAMLLAVAVAAIVHFPILLSDTVLWDSCIVENAHKEKDFSLLEEMFTTHGAPDVAYLHYFVSKLPFHLFAYRAISFACILIATACIFQLVYQSSYFGEREAFAVAAVSAAFPYYSVWQELIMLPYSMGYAAFYLAALVYLQALKSSPENSALKLAATLLFVFSFVIQSLLVTYYVVFLFYALLLVKIPSFAAYYRFFFERSLMLLIPPIYFVARRILAPVQEVYEGYNDLSFSVWNCFKLFIVSPKRIAVDQIRETIRFIVDEPVSFAILAVAGVLLLMPIFVTMRTLSTRQLSSAHFWSALVFAVFAFYAAIFPYAAVNKFPVISSFLCRHGLVAILPVALGIVLVARYFLGDRAFASVVGLLLVLGFTQQAWNQIRWQNRYVKHQAIVEALRASDPIPPGIAIVRDHVNLGMPERNRLWDITWLLKIAHGTEHHFGLAEHELNYERYHVLRHPGVERIYMTSDFQETGNDTLVEIYPNDIEEELQTYLRYLLSNAASRKEWLKSMVRLESKPIKIDWEKSQISVKEPSKQAA